jgi:hypothetical protein
MLEEMRARASGLPRPTKLTKAGAKANVELSEAELRKTAGGRPAAIIPRDRLDGVVVVTRLFEGSRA